MLSEAELKTSYEKIDNPYQAKEISMLELTRGPNGDLLFDPNSEEFLINPYPIYAKLRAESPIIRGYHGAWIFMNYEDVSYIMKDKAFLREYWAPLVDIFGKDIRDRLGFKLVADWMVNKNPPEHMPIRRVVSKALTTKVVEKLKPSLLRVANELIDSFIEKGSADLLMDYSYPLTTIATCELLGIPKEDHHLFLADSRSSNRTYEDKTFTEEDLKNDNKEIQFLSNYFSAMCENRKRHPQDDLVSALLTANQEEQNIVTDDYMVSNIFLLFGAGYENTSNTIATLLYYLYKNPTQLAALKSNYTAKIHSAVEEAVRYEPPLQISSPMIATYDMDISGVQIRKGDVLLAHMGSAAHDPKVYPDPDRFDISRENLASVHFGIGVHTCLGIYLGKVKAEIAIDTLFKRIPNLMVDINNPKWRPQASIRGLASLPAYW